MITLLPDGICPRCKRYFQLEFSSTDDPDWFLEAMYYSGKPSKPFRNFMKWLDTGLCGRCYTDVLKGG